MSCCPKPEHNTQNETHGAFAGLVVLGLLLGLWIVGSLDTINAATVLLVGTALHVNPIFSNPIHSPLRNLQVWILILLSTLFLSLTIYVPSWSCLTAVLAFGGAFVFVENKRPAKNH